MIKFRSWGRVRKSVDDATLTEAGSEIKSDGSHKQSDWPNLIA